MEVLCDVDVMMDVDEDVRWMGDDVGC